MTPYMDEIRRQEQKAAASGQLPLPADVKPAQPVVKPAGEEATRTTAPTQTYADILRGISTGNAPTASRGTGAGVGAGRPPTLEIPKVLTVEEAQTRAKQFFDSKELNAQQDRIAEAARERLADTLSYARTNRPPVPFQELSKRLNTEEFDEVGEKEKAKGMAIMMAGLKMMESPYGGKGLGAALRNIGAGAIVGAKELQQSNKEFKELAQKRMQMRTTIEAAQNAAERGDFERELVLRQRGDDINNSMDQNKALIAKYAFGLEGQAAVGAFDQAAQSAEAAKRTQFSADVQRDIAASGERAANERNAATIKAATDAEIRKALLPSETIRTAGILGGAPYGVLPTPEQLQNGLRALAEKTDMGKLYVQSKAEFDAKNMNPQKQFMSPQEFLALYGVVNSFRSNPAPTNTPTGQIFK
jgi:hypothetical protein